MSSKTPNASPAKIALAHKLVLVFAILALVLPFVGIAVVHTASCLYYTPRIDGKISVDGHSIDTETVRSEASRNLGLSGRPCIKNNQAMVFLFNASDKTNHCFWMKDMRFPIDIVWLDGQKRVIYRVINALPESYPKQYCPNVPTNYVLEVKAQTADSLGLKIGTQLSF